MAKIRVSTKVGQMLRARGQHNVTKGQIISSVALGAGVGLVSLGGPLSIAAGVALAAGTMVLKGGKTTALGRNAVARGTALDTLSRGQTPMGALYGRKPGSAYLNSSAEKRASAPGGRVVGGASPVPGRGWAAGRGFANSKVQQAAQAARRRMGK